jgi:DNA-binding NarL/FixJ family response regulator
MSSKIKILVVDDHPLVCDGLAELIRQQPDFEICGVAANQTDALALLESAQPTVAIVDITLENGSGIELTKRIRDLHPGVRVLVLSMHDENLYAERALRAGARGYIMKSEVSRKIVLGIRAVLTGKIFISENIANRIAQKSYGGPDETPESESGVEDLSSRELEVFQLIGRGYGTRQIAETLGVGFKTVQTYSTRIKEKLQLRNATELMREAMLWHERQTPKQAG